MSGRPNNSKQELFIRAAFLCAALVLTLLLLQPLFTVIVRSALSAGPADSADAPRETGPQPGIVLFADQTDPCCAPLFSDFSRFCAEKGWEISTYDCRGNATNQKGQIEDFLRTGTADVAVLCSVMEQGEQDAMVKELRKTCKIITIGQECGTTAGRYVAAHIGEDENGRIDAVGDYFHENLKRNEGVILLTDVPDKPAEQQYIKALGAKNITVLDTNYTWTEQIYAERYLNTALDHFSDVGGVLCTSSAGTSGALKVLQDKSLRDSVKIVSLNYDPSMEDPLALADLDAAIAVFPDEIEKMLEETVEKLVKGEEVEDSLIPLHTLTATLDTAGE